MTHPRKNHTQKQRNDVLKPHKIENLEIFKNVAYIMAYHADKSIPSSIDDWLEDFEMFSVYEILPEILELWGVNMQTEVESKNFKKVQGR